jgi:mannose-6-phosphate isomerase-like protein (cupin superfamily)
VDETVEQLRKSLRSLWVIGHRVTPITCAGRVVTLEVATPPEMPGPPPHYHQDCTECFYVTAGTLGVMRDGEWLSLGVGEHVEVPPGVVHTFRNDSTDEVRTLTAFEPMGFEAFFTEFGYDISEPGSFEVSLSDDSIRRVVEGCGQFGMIIQPNESEAET